MSGVEQEYIKEYIGSLMHDGHEGILKEIENYALENSIPIVQRETAEFLELMVNIKKPPNILELGTAVGYSAILMSLSSHKKNHITTIERDRNMIEIARKNIKKYNFEQCIDIIEGDCLEVLKNIEGKFDLIFMDAGKAHYNHFLPYCLKVLDERGIIVADNVLFRGMVASDELVKRRKITIVKRMRKYLDMVSDRNKFITSIIPMGDGIAVTMRRK
ncbi:O-methyltransferase [Clostridium luticellarii]|jgi:predicted O-methyltransferase YrrM|uniref:tRNA 5-hydroxyuridine methyltransferase n=1 Tax=Clostridium luticellarii TaxID=1691940 RepID=A0A2T0BRL6_9CLOT|nr:O-methyltransferase [Clostridium luticellarii]MCI1943821.1 O-methyltransferase [Clostridium luticellarii]MCI1967082.1 O-methyltransferase [Clostridium luticellarii]MCI1994449.1 O-methyltransferase [Clostridium luticellarii]MCI2038598.1 O-methyltransferase [Clostridium luticellarii]PRR86472.1 putative O-methyltransferase [Clostridium luticellarii]